MNLAANILRFVLAAFAIVAGGEAFLRYWVWPEPRPEAQEFLISLTAAGYIWPAVGTTFLISGVLLCFKRCVLIALLLLAPVTVNIALYHLFLDQSLGNAFPALALSVLHLLLFAIYSRPLGVLFRSVS